MTAPTCCERPMARDNGQYVCRKCHSWVDPSTPPSDGSAR